MKTFGEMSIAFLYDDETDMITNEPILRCSQPGISIDVLHRVYISLGMHLHIKSCEGRYSDENTEEIERNHKELMEILDGKK